MKFIPPTQTSTSSYNSGQIDIENYILNTKDIIDTKLPSITTPNKNNLSTQQQKLISKFKRSRQIITIKPADKNLGIVIMDTDDYLAQCSCLLADSNTYRLGRRLSNTNRRCNHTIQRSNQEHKPTIIQIPVTIYDQTPNTENFTASPRSIKTTKVYLPCCPLLLNQVHY